MNKPNYEKLTDACMSICDSIQNKILERGLFTKYLGKNFELDISPEINDDNFILKISVSTIKKHIEHKSLVEMTFYIHEKFFEDGKAVLVKSQLNLLKSKWIETIFTSDGKIIFAIDD